MRKMEHKIPLSIQHDCLETLLNMYRLGVVIVVIIIITILFSV